MPKSSLTTDTFWHFSCDYYQNAKVQSALLLLQNHYSANVNLALLCIWLNTLNLRIESATLKLLHREVSTFSNEFTKPLRALRAHYKDSLQTHINYQTLRSHLLNAELCLEKEEQALLLAHFGEPNRFTFQATHICNLKHYLMDVLKLSKTDLDQTSLQPLFER